MDVAEIFSDVDDHGFDDTSDERKLAVLNDVYHDVCTREPWPFLEVIEDDTTLTLTGNVLTASNPVRAILFLRATQELQPMRLDDFMRIYGSRLDRTGKAFAYYFRAGEIIIYPEPTSVDDMALAYIQREVDLGASDDESDILLPSEFIRSVLVNGMLYKLYALEDDTELAAGFQQYYESGIMRMREAIWRRQYQRAEIVLEDSFDGLYGGEW
jgi:hypothetical protein